MPHDSLDDIASASVVKAVAMAAAERCEAASPERSGAAPTSADVVDHKEAMLNEVAVRPYFLVRIAREASVGRLEEARGVGELVVAGGPTGAMARGATQFAEQFSATLGLRVVEVASGRDSQAAVPNHEVDIVAVAHLGGESVAEEIVADIGGGVTRFVPLREIGVEPSLNVGVVGRGVGVDRGSEAEVVAALVATVDVGDIPDGVAARGILERAAGERIGEALGVVGVAIVGRGGPVVARPESRVEVGAGVVFPLILSFERIVGYGIDEASAVDADGSFEAESQLAVGSYQRSVESILGDVDLGIDETVAFAVVELVAPLVGVVEPGDLDFILVDGSLERRDSLSLRHASDRGFVAVGGAVVDDEEVAVGPVVGAVALHASAVAIARVAGFAARADIDGAQAVERRVVLSYGMFEKHFAILESRGHTSAFGGRRRVLVGRSRLIESGAELAAGESFLGDPVGLVGVGRRRLDRVILARDDAHRQQQSC